MRGRATVALAILCAAGPLAAQHGMEWQLGGVGTLARANYVGVGLGLAHRAARVRLGVQVAGGMLEDQAAGRGEILLGYLLTPARRRGVGVYAAGGLAMVATGDDLVGRLVAVLGVEGTPGGRSGWYLEAGVGGGVRLALGYRLRHLHR